MCRLFGFRSVIESQVHRSLIAADNALGVQSNQHPDGWGVAYYVDGTPHITRSAATALTDRLFHRVSGVVASETVLAHVRKATVGDMSVLNCHPFQYGKWVFAHNGEIRQYAKHKDKVLQEIAPRLRRYILGDTDSEAIFFLFLTKLALTGPLNGKFAAAEVVAALRETVDHVRDLTDGPTEPEQALLTLMATDGSTLAAIQSGKELFWSTYKTCCADRDTCPHLAEQCEAPTTTGFVNHLILSSEPLSGENIWVEMSPGEAIGVDWRMRLVRDDANSRQLNVVP